MVTKNVTLKFILPTFIVNAPNCDKACVYRVGGRRGGETREQYEGELGLRWRTQYVG